MTDKADSGGVDWVRFGLLYSFGVVANMAASHEAPLVGHMSEALGRPPGAIGAAMGAQFVAYLLLGTVFGQLVARLGVRRAGLIGMTTILLAAIANLYVNAFYALLAANLTQGMGMLLVTVAAQVGVSQQDDDATRSRALALWATSPVVGLALGLFLSSTVADGSSWRLAFAILAAVAAGVAMCTALLLPTGRVIARAPAPDARTSGLRAETRVVRLSLALLLMILTMNGSVNLWPTFLADIHDVSIGTVGARSSIAMLIGIVGSLSIAAALGRGVSASLLLIFIAIFGGLSAVLVFSGTGGLAYATIGMVAWNICASAMMALIFASLPCVVRDPGNLPAATGLLYQISSVGAMCGAPIFLTFATLPNARFALMALILVALLAMVLLFPVHRSKGDKTYQ